MSLRAIPDSASVETISEIDALLTKVERDHAVTIPLAVESGSRAWGFPSPDSDYDCRFVYVRKSSAYLSPWSERDVIETPLIGDLDVNGWDLGKALKLMLKGNAVILEWLRSPFVYRGDVGFRDEFLALAFRHADAVSIARHYLHLGERQRRVYFGDGQDVALKKLFYALRPAVALRWMRRHPTEIVPPMHFPTLIAESELPQDVASLVDRLLILKAETRELGNAPLPAEIANFVDAEFALARSSLAHAPTGLASGAKRDAEDFFRRTVLRWD